MNKQITCISRIDAYCETECVNCIFANCSGRCKECKCHIERGYRGFIDCGCLQHKPNKEKSCPLFKEMEK